MLIPVDPLNEERNRIKGFFINHYQPTEQIDLLDFYKDYYFHVKMPVKEQQELNPQATADHHQEHYNAGYREWVERLKIQLKPILKQDTQEININLQMAADLTRVNNQKYQFSTIPRGMFAQCFTKEGQLFISINHIFQGAGRAGGRFLHLFDENVTANQRSLNQQIGADNLLMELTDGSSFNANLHPPLLPYEIKLPDGQNGLPSNLQIPVSDIYICYCQDNGELRLMHKLTGKRIIPFDLCLQSITQRSKLYQLLGHFSPDQSIGFVPIQNAVRELLYKDAGPVVKKDIYHFPRLVFDNQLILKKRAWSVSSKCIPIKDDRKSDAAYFMEINLWRKKHELPVQVFLYLRSKASGAEKDGADDYKPQYIRFDTPLLVLLLSRLLKKAEEYIYLEEMLPDTATLGQQPVNEVLIQWNHQL